MDPGHHGPLETRIEITVNSFPGKINAMLFQWRGEASSDGNGPGAWICIRTPGEGIFTPVDEGKRGTRGRRGMWPVVGPKDGVELRKEGPLHGVVAEGSKAIRPVAHGEANDDIDIPTSVCRRPWPGDPDFGKDRVTADDVPEVRGPEDRVDDGEGFYTVGDREIRRRRWQGQSDVAAGGLRDGDDDGGSL